MGDKYAVNDAFLKIINSLIEKKIVKNKGELAGMLEVSPSTISEIIAKRQGVTVEFIQKFCGVFHEITPNDFFGIESPVHASNDLIIELQSQVIRLQDELLAARKA